MFRKYIICIVILFFLLVNISFAKVDSSKMSDDVTPTGSTPINYQLRVDPGAGKKLAYILTGKDELLESATYDVVISQLGDSGVAYYYWTNMGYLGCTDFFGNPTYKWYQDANDQLRRVGTPDITIINISGDLLTIDHIRLNIWDKGFIYHGCDCAKIPEAISGDMWIENMKPYNYISTGGFHLFPDNNLPIGTKIRYNHSLVINGIQYNTNIVTIIKTNLGTD